MMIFQLLNQYEGIAKAAFFGCAAKLNKSIQTNIMEILLLIMCIPRKINFLQLGRYGIRCEQCYRQTAERSFDWLGFNMNLGARYFHQPGKGLGRLPSGFKAPQRRCCVLSPNGPKTGKRKQYDPSGNELKSGQMQ